jgi:hypothetical protein
MTRTEGIPVRVMRVLPELVACFSGRACMCETRLVFSSSSDVSDANVIGNFEIQILCTLMPRFELVNDQNHKTGKKF